MFRHDLVKIVMFSALLVGAPGPATSAPIPKLTAETRLKNAYEKAFLGFEHGQATIRMIIEDTLTNTKRDRTLELKARVSEKGGSSFLVKFLKPGDIAGTAFLVKNRKNQGSAQYIYLPEFNIVKPVASGNAASSFFGSDFLYGDLFLSAPNTKAKEIELAELPDRKLAGVRVKVIEVKTKFPGSPYSKMEVLIGESSGIIAGIDYYGLNKKLLKKMRVKKVRKMESRLIPVHLTMTNEQKNSKTDLIVEKINTRIRFKEQDFTKQAMKRF